MAEAVHKLPSEFNVGCAHTHKHASPLNTIMSNYANLPTRVPYVRYNKMIQRLFKSRERLTATLFLMLPPEPKLHSTVSMVAHRHRLNSLHVFLSKPQNHKIWSSTEALTHNHQCIKVHHSEHVRDEGLDAGPTVTGSLERSGGA